MTVHVHLSFGAWRDASRAWRAGTVAIEAGYADDVVYVGHRSAGQADREQIAPHQTMLRLGAEPPRPGSPRLFRALALPRWWWTCWRALDSQGVSLIVAHSLAALPIAVWLSRRWRTPLLYDAHELESERNGWSWSLRRLARLIESWLIRACGHTIVVNDTIQEWYESAYPGVSISTVRNVPVIPDKIRASRLRETLGLTAQAIIFVYCGVLAPGRGLFETIEAFEGLGPERHLVLVGSGPDREALIDRSRSMANVHVHDAVPQSELIALLSGADVGIIVPRTESLSYRYMLPNKVFEYAAAGLAICVGTGEELQRFAASYPAARTAELDVSSLRGMALGWSRETLDEVRPMIGNYRPPRWQEEKARLLCAYDEVLRKAQSQSNFQRRT